MMPCDPMVLNICFNKGVKKESETYTCAKVKGGGWCFQRTCKAPFLPSQFLLYEVSKIPSFGDIFMLSINPHLIAHLNLFFPLVEQKCQVTEILV